MLQSKEFLFLIVDGKLVLSHFVLLIKSFETFDSFFEEDPIHHRSVLLVVCPEVGNVLDQDLDILFEGLQVLGLLDSQASVDFFRQINESVPLGPKEDMVVTLIFVSDPSREVVVKECLYIHDWVETDIDNCLETSDLLQFFHDDAQRVNVLDHSLRELVG